MASHRLRIVLLEKSFGIYKLPPKATVPSVVANRSLVSITRSQKELTIVCEEGLIENPDYAELGWRCLHIDSAFNLDATGVIAAIAEPLAKASISLYVVSTFDTDYILVKANALEKALAQLAEAGHQVAPVC